uniref:Protein FAR1-RELATED SEQUENCE n=1 Tax=Ananas comosus var. bracteatus TaxID=296719 RepID=A0A6V7QGT5_ANACO|nr:unnamed protein product [Ananas comosus var. bracteatus]
MYGKYPKAIITDQDPAMKKAIEIVFPTTIHSDGDGRDLREEDKENDDNGENAGEEEDTYLSDGVEEEDDDSDFGENILNGLEDSAVVEDVPGPSPRLSQRSMFQWRSNAKLTYGRSYIIIAYYVLLWVVSVLNLL